MYFLVLLSMFIWKKFFVFIFIFIINKKLLKSLIADKKIHYFNIKYHKKIK
jgi:hypothetical protein